MSDLIFESMKRMAEAQKIMARGEESAARARVVVFDTPHEMIEDIIRIEVERYGVNYQDAKSIAVDCLEKMQKGGLI